MSILTREERLVFEAVASFVVGIIAGIVSVVWPDHACFEAIALAGVLDILQGKYMLWPIFLSSAYHRECFALFLFCVPSASLSPPGCVFASTESSSIFSFSSDCCS